MKKTTLRRAGCVAAALGLSVSLLIACGDDDNTPLAKPDGGGTADSTAPKPDGTATNDAAPDAGPTPVSIKFKAKVGTQDFKCGTTYTAQGTTNDTVEPRDLRFFVQDLKLVTSAGQEVPVQIDVRSPWQTADVALLDFEDGTGKCNNGNPELNSEVTGKVPSGTYTGIVFTNGVPAALNHLDPATLPAPLTAGGMTWGWLFGHLFIKAEMSSTSADGGIGLLHLGSVGCANSLDGGEDDFNKGPTMACSRPHRNVVKLTGYNPSTSTIVLDVKTLFAGTDTTQSSQCHSGGPACPPLFQAVGLDIDGGAPMSTAPAFRVE